MGVLKSCYQVARKVSNVSRDLSARQRFVDLWNGKVVVPCVQIFSWQPSFQEKSLLKICLMSNNFDITKVHVITVFVDVTRSLGVVVKQRDSLFVFHNPRLQLSFCLTIVRPC